MRLYLIRHPKPLVAPDICYGRSDLAVAPDEIAAALARCLPQLPTGLPFFVSPLQRCQGLAQQLFAASAGSALSSDARLQEMDFGSWEMQPWSAIARVQIDAWASQPVAFRPGGGETVLELTQRVLGLLAQLQQSGLPAAALVCHAGPIRVVHACMQLLIASAGPRPLQALPADQIAQLASSAYKSIDYGQVACLNMAGP